MLKELMISNTLTTKRIMEMNDKHRGEILSRKGVVSSLWKCYDSSKVATSMVLVQLFATGMMLLSRVILGNGTFVFALMTYRHVIAAISVAPLALILERGQKKDNKFNVEIWFWIFINGLIGITGAMGLYYYGLTYTTATYAVNFLNLVPIVTFVLSVIVGMETLCLHRWSDRFKVIGAVLCVGGSITTSLYKGKEFYIHHVGLHHHSQHVVHGMKNLVKGTIMLTGSCLCYAVWFILQAKLVKMFPLKYWVTMVTCVIATVQSAVIGLCMNRTKAAWKLGFDVPLLTIVYSGVLSTAATFCLLSYAIKNRGPTYPPMFSPLTLIFVAVLEALLLGEPIRLGTVLGTILIIVGLYSYLWGKKNESNTKMPTENQASPNVEVYMIDPITSSRQL